MCQSRTGPLWKEVRRVRGTCVTGFLGSGQGGSSPSPGLLGEYGPGEFPARACAAPGTAGLRSLKGRQTRALMLLPRPLPSSARLRGRLSGPEAVNRESPVPRWVEHREGGAA